ncbi:MAG: hypothetical protein KAT25_02045 [Sulfuriflexus sp.]|nr:hypothetical protein [Sulfuriflexus sp.]
MSDAQDKSLQEDPEMGSTDASEEVVMDEVAEDRSVSKKKSGFIGFLITLVLLSGAAGAGWYYQSMWFPQVKEGAEQIKSGAEQAQLKVELKVQQAQAWLNDLLSFGKGRDRMAAPTPKQEPVETTAESSKPNYVIAAISDPKAELKSDAKEEVVAVEDSVVTSEAEQKVVEPVNEVVEIIAEIENVEVTEAEEKPGVEVVVIEPVVAEESTLVTEEAAVVAEKASAPTVESKTLVVASEVPAVKPLQEIKRNVVNLAEARKAFWQRDLPKAEALYKKQINSSVADADSWGELGNIYYFQAKWKLAAKAYTEAAILLLNKGDFPQAMFLHYIVTGLDPIQVKRIDEHVQALQAPLKG